MMKLLLDKMVRQNIDLKHNLLLWLGEIELNLFGSKICPNHIFNHLELYI